MTLIIKILDWFTDSWSTIFIYRVYARHRKFRWLSIKVLLFQTFYTPTIFTLMIIFFRGWNGFSKNKNQYIQLQKYKWIKLEKPTKTLLNRLTWMSHHLNDIEIFFKKKIYISITLIKKQFFKSFFLNYFYIYFFNKKNIN